MAVGLSARATWLRDEVVVEEKLDGANVMIWQSSSGMLRSAGRAGPDSMDRGGQFGRLRAWVADRDTQVRHVLAAGHVLYGEWLWVTHSVGYDSLPDYLIVLDLWTPTGGFASADERDERIAAAGLFGPPRLRRGVVGETATLEHLTRKSRYGSNAAEGAVLRRDHLDGRFDRCKWIRPEFSRRSDHEWRQRIARNELGKPLG